MLHCCLVNSGSYELYGSLGWRGTQEWYYVNYCIWDLDHIFTLPIHDVEGCQFTAHSFVRIYIKANLVSSSSQGCYWEGYSRACTL